MGYYMRKYWKANTLAFLFSILSAAFSAASNISLIQLFQSVFEWDVRRFILWAAIILGISLLSSVIDTLKVWAESRAKMGMNNCFRRDITATLLSMPYQSFHAEDSGSHLSRYTNDVSKVTDLAWDTMYALVKVCASILFNVIALAYMHWSLLAASLFMAVVIVNAPKLFGNKMQSLGKNCAEEMAAATGKLKDLLSGFDVFCAFGRKALFAQKADEASREMELPQHKLTCVKEIISEGIGTIVGVCQIAVVLLVGALSIHGVIIQAAIAGACNMSAAVYSGLSSIGRLRLDLIAAQPYFEKVTVHADHKVDAALREIPALSNAICMENVTFSYGNHPVLNNLSLDFHRGGKYALVGPSGCGKSTVLKILLGWLPDYTGAVTYDGKDIREYDTQALQNRIGYIEQNVYLLNTSIRENITLGKNFTQSEIEHALEGSALAKDLPTLPDGLETQVGENGSNLSGGQKQRVAIARALLHGRSILLVDEGTSALDKENADIVEECLLANPDLTLILVSHHLGRERKAQFDAVYTLQSPKVSAEV